jgi:beta-lactam-binding protein with PASTA domain
MKISAVLHRSLRFFRTLLKNPFFWGGAAVLALIGTTLYFVVDAWLMPAYTRQDVEIVVPDVRQMPYEEAERVLTAQKLRVEREEQRFNPNLPRDVVVDQKPPARATVKPGRRIYLTVNSGTVPMVQVPSVEGISLREARNRMATVGLIVEEVLPDSIPSPAPNTVTRQEPAPGETAPQGSGVKLWYSTGLGETYVTVPKVTGMSTEQARAFLLEHRLRSVVIGEGTGPVKKQSPEPGTSVREGFEVRLFTQ